MNILYWKQHSGKLFVFLFFSCFRWISAMSNWYWPTTPFNAVWIDMKIKNFHVWQSITLCPHLHPAFPSSNPWDSYGLGMVYPAGPGQWFFPCAQHWWGCALKAVSRSWSLNLGRTWRRWSVSTAGQQGWWQVWDTSLVRNSLGSCGCLSLSWGNVMVAVSQSCVLFCLLISAPFPPPHCLCLEH